MNERSYHGATSRSHNNIKRIAIDGTEYELPQYADDTTFILDGSAQSLGSTMTVLDYYADISGLKINYTKSKAIWIGSKTFSKHVYHHTRWKLEWGENLFTMLGINFTIDLNEIVDYKTRRNLIKLWSCRKCTCLGRVTVLKTLIIQK